MDSDFLTKTLENVVSTITQVGLNSRADARRRTMTRAWLWFGCVLLFGGACAARSEEDIQAEFRAYVAAHNQCSSTEECVLALAGCPLGCAVAVNAQHQSSVERRARELVDEYESSGRSCQYDCAVVEAACSENHCQLVAR